MTDLCNEMKQFGKGIGSKPRYRIVEVLFSGPKTVGELATHTGLSQPLVSQHLRVLKETRLVTDERQGQEVWYTVNSRYLVSLLTQLIKEISASEEHHS